MGNFFMRMLSHDKVKLIYLNYPCLSRSDCLMRGMHADDE